MTDTFTLPECQDWRPDVVWFECITQSPDEPAPPEYLAVCTVEAELLACSFRCPDECGGHPICRPCFDLAHERGELHPKDAP